MAWTVCYAVCGGRCHRLRDHTGLAQRRPQKNAGFSARCGRGGPSTSPLGAPVTLALSRRIVLAAGWIAFCGGYLVRAGFAQHNLFWDLFGMVALVGAVGAVFRWHWSQWLVYCVAAAIVGIWLVGL